MATIDDLRRIALALPGVTEDEGPAFRANGRHIAWPWRERVDPKKARVPRPEVPVVHVADLDDKEALVTGEPDLFFITDHYDGYAMVMVRLDAIDLPRLAEVIADSHAKVMAMPPPRARPRRT